MDLHFNCTQCGKCCRDTKIPLTVAEAVNWLSRGHPVQLVVEASPWSAALDHNPRAAHFMRRSFPGISATLPVRVVVMLVANVTGRCPNLLDDERCGIYAERPLVCRIYPAETNPFIALEPAAKFCPPQAWLPDRPVLQRGETLMDAVVASDVERWRAEDASDAQVKGRLCRALSVTETAMVHEAVLVYSPAMKDLLSALAFSLANASSNDSPDPWRFVSTRTDTLSDLSQRGGSGRHLQDMQAPDFKYFGLGRRPIFRHDEDLAMLPARQG